MLYKNLILNSHCSIDMQRFWIENNITGLFSDIIADLEGVVELPTDY